MRMFRGMIFLLVSTPWVTIANFLLRINFAFRYFSVVSNLVGSDG
jgi:hypothetical protein